MPIKMLEALKGFFNTEGYPELSSRELLDFMKTDKPGYTECAKLCAEALGETLIEVKPQPTE